MPWELGHCSGISSLEVKVSAWGRPVRHHLSLSSKSRAPKRSAVHLLFQTRGDNDLSFSLWSGQSWHPFDQVGIEAKQWSSHSDLPYLLCTYLSWKTKWPSCQMSSALILQLKIAQEWASGGGKGARLPSDAFLYATHAALIFTWYEHFVLEQAIDVDICLKFPLYTWPERGTESIGGLSRVTEKLVRSCTYPQGPYLGLAISAVICHAHKGSVTHVAKPWHLSDL